MVTRGRSPRRAIIWGAGLGTLPDLDVLLPFENDLQAMIQHRTWTHSWLVHVVLGPLIGLLLSRIDRTWSRLTWIALVCLVLITHSMLDAFTIYGTWVLWPLMSAPLMGGSIFIIDPLYTLPLLVGLFIAWRNPVPGVAARWSLIGITVSCLYLGWGIGMQHHVETLARNSLAASGITPERLVATPTPFNSILWRIIAPDGEVYHEGYYSLLDQENTPRFQAWPRQPGLASKIPSTVEFDEFRNFNHGFYKLRQQSGQIIASDLRMGVEPWFFFEFVLSDPSDGAVPRAFSRQLDLPRMFRWLGQRLTGTDLPPLSTVEQNDG